MPRHSGLIAAALTPFNRDGSINVSPITAVVDQLIREGIQGLYVCGSTGEGISLTTDERKSIAEAYVSAAAGRIPVMIQVGHNSLRESKGLAEHASLIGADVISATCPSYFKVADIDTLVACMQEIASAGAKLPFYYYHIPALTGSNLDMANFLAVANTQIPNLAGLKFTTPELHIYQACQNVVEGKFEIFWGTDEMLLAGLATGAKAAIGSTYNIAAPLYNQMIAAFDAGNLELARQLQLKSVEMIEVAKRYPFHSAVKHIMTLRGLPELGDCRLPLPSLTTEQKSTLESNLKSIGYFEWSVA